MPRDADLQRLARIEAEQRRLAESADTIRGAIRERYGAITTQLQVEKLTEREFRDILTHSLRVGGRSALTALKALSTADPASPERRPSDEHGVAARRRPAPASGAASTGDGGDPQGTAP